MSRFTACIDNISKKEMILSKCNYDNACKFLEKENKDKKFGRFLSATNRTMFLAEIRYEKANFVYDGVREMLLRIT